MESSNSNSSTSDLPFLVTHWLSNYNENSRIRELGSELARAFGDQGAFGTAASTSFSNNNHTNPALAVSLQHRRSARYEDIARCWGGLSGDHLEAVVHAGARQQLEQLQQINNTTNNTTSNINEAVSILHKPILTNPKEQQNKCVTSLKRATDLKLQCRATERELRQIQTSLALQEQQRLDLQESKMPSTAEEEGILKAKELEAERVTSHLQLRRTAVLQKQAELEVAHQKEHALSLMLYANLQRMQRLHDTTTSTSTPCWNPLQCNSNNSNNNNNLLQFSTVSRPQYGNGIANGNANSTVTMLQRRTLMQRLRHTLTINCHLYYPVYCLKFDKTRRYFITGADDHLAKIFYVGGYTSGNEQHHHHQHQHQKRHTFSYTNGCGAVLVATLRGHNGVITDMDVNCDNMLVATASEDGSVRVWGLRDGACVAVLRHCGGVNMVSFSKTVPYRLVSVGEDGLARLWDIRVACIKRCPGASVRSDYALENDHDHDNDDDNDNAMEVEEEEENGDNNNSSNNNNNGAAAVSMEVEAQAPAPAQAPLFVPPLPEAADVINIAPTQHLAQPDPPGVDNIDEGCLLLQKLQHGTPVNNTNNNAASSTRSRSKAVNVLCVAVCPIGGHVATGSDDGMVRVWHDDSTSDNSVLMSTLAGHLNPITDIAYSSKGDRLLTASMKDGTVRIWSWRSENDDNNNNSSSCSNTNNDSKQQQLLCSPTPLLIRLGAGNNDTANNTSNNNAISRRLNNRTRNNNGTAATHRANSQILCDVATWSHDDSLVFTSQSIAANANSTTNDAVQPGSVRIGIYDAYTGHCCMSIPLHGSVAALPVLLPHPSDIRVFASGTSDGTLRVHTVDIRRQEHSITLEHKNIIEYGAVADAVLMGKACGYLDGAWGGVCGNYADCLVVTDDCGRVGVLDCSSCLLFDDNHQQPVTWMREQYFANDYYELTYDANLYPIDARARTLPHLCPRAARVNHAGSSLMDHVTEAAYKHIRGPLPMDEEECRYERQRLKELADTVRGNGGLLQRNVVQRGIMYNHYSSASSVVVPNINSNNGNNNNRNAAAARPSSSSSAHQQQATVTARSVRMLSSNFRYLDYAPSSESEVDEDEEYEVEARRSRSGTRRSARSASGNNRNRRGNTRRRASSNNANDDDDDDEDDDASDNSSENLSEDDVMSLDSNELSEYGTRNNSRRRSNGANRSTTTTRRRRQNNNNNNNNNSSGGQRLGGSRRSSGRQSSSILESATTVNRRYDEVNSDDDIDPADCWFYTENNVPESSNPMVRRHPNDYESGKHMWKVTSQIEGQLQRSWLQRERSRYGYSGRQTYVPQCGDELVYVPIAHKETLLKFPLTCAPPWNALNGLGCVKCKVMDVRMRFPCQGHVGIGNGGESVVCVTRLKVIGVPSHGSGGGSDHAASDHSFPWHTEFDDAQESEAITLEVNVHQNDQPEFLIPYSLYKNRLGNLERVLAHYFQQERGDRQRLRLSQRQRQRRPPLDLATAVYSKVNLLSYFAELFAGNGNGDPVFDPHHCHIQNIFGLSHSLDENALVFAGAYDEPGGQLPRAGFECIEVVYSCGSVAYISPWELDVIPSHDEEGLDTLSLAIPTLSQHAIHFLSTHLDKMVSEVDGAGHFMDEVPDNYRDYLQMTPIPMYIEFIKHRLLCGYYSHMEGVIQDARCLWENCMKYNVYIEDAPGICNDADEVLQYIEAGCNALTSGGDAEGSLSAQQQHPVVMVEVEAVNLDGVNGLNADNETINANQNANNNAEAAENVMAAASIGQRGRRGNRGTGRRRGRNGNSVLENLANANRVAAAPIVAANNSGNAREDGRRRSSRVSVPRVMLGTEEEVDEELPNARRSSRIRGMPPAASEIQENPTLEMANNFHESSSASEDEDSSVAEVMPSRSRRSARHLSADDNGDASDSNDEDDDSVSGSASSLPQSPATPMQRCVTRTRVRVSLRSSDMSDLEGSLEAELPSRQDDVGSRESTPPSSPEAPERDVSESEASVPSDDEENSDDDFSSDDCKPKAKAKPRTKAKRNAKARKVKVVEEVDDGYGSLSDDDEEFSAPRRTPKRGKAAAKSKRKRKTSADSSPAKSTRNHGRRSGVSYHDLSHSELSDYEDSDVEDKEEVHARSGRKRKSTASTPATNKRKKISAFPTIPQWPSIQRRKLQKVSKIIFNMVKEKDVDEIFHYPVTDEEAPDYSSTIDFPMDFSTIEKKLSSYKDINDLREDLILIFENCCYYNGEGYFWEYAMDMWKSLPDVFIEACETAGIVT